MPGHVDEGTVEDTWAVFLHFHLEDPAQMGTFLDAYAPVVEDHVVGWPGFLGATLYASTDGTRVINHTRWVDEAAYLDFLERPDPAPRLAAIERALGRVPSVRGPEMTTTHTYRPARVLPATERHVVEP